MPVTNRRPTSRRLRTALVLVPVLPALALQGWGPPASAGGQEFVPTDGSHYVTAEFGYTGAPQSFTVPAGVTSLEVTAYGASGGSATPNDGSNLTGLGGRGAAVSAILEVQPGAVLSVLVGGRGGDNGDGGGAAGWNGGGGGGAANRVGAGGGGATDLRTCAPDADCDSLASRILVAGGGGGAGFGYDNVIPGADAGAAGGSYTANRGTVDGGQPGTASAGGAGGAAGDEFDRISRGGDGVLGSGGVGGGRTGPDYVPTLQENAGAGGGGGGLYGGGGGGDNRYYGAGGGGGSSLAPEGTTVGLADADQFGQLSITYDLGPVTDLNVTAEPSTIPASGSATTTVTASSETTTGPGVAGLEVSFSSSDPAQSFGPVTDHGDGTYSAELQGSTTAGDATITATGEGTPDVIGTATVTQDAYTAPGITAAASSTRAARNGWYRTPVLVSFTCTGSRLVGDCPASELRSASGKNQVVTRTVADDQGGESTATVAVSIDRSVPKVRVTGAKKGATYASKRKLTCRATDTFSGVASCRVTTTQRKVRGGTVVSWTGRALDRAGNAATTRGSYTIRGR